MVKGLNSDQSVTFNQPFQKKPLDFVTFQLDSIHLTTTSNTPPCLAIDEAEGFFEVQSARKTNIVAVLKPAMGLASYYFWIQNKEQQIKIPIQPQTTIKFGTLTPDYKLQAINLPYFGTIKFTIGYYYK